MMSRLIQTLRKTLNRNPLRAAPPPPVRNVKLYIGGIHSSNEPTDIVDHLRAMQVDGDIRVRTLTTKGEWRSFCAEIPMQDIEPLCSAEKWPPRVNVRPFRTQRRDSADEGHDQLQHRRPRHGAARGGQPLHPSPSSFVNADSSTANQRSLHIAHPTYANVCCGAAHRCCQH